jgi:hypothetical protein
MTWYGGDRWLDYVQLTGFMPMARMDYGCDPARDPRRARNAPEFLFISPAEATEVLSPPTDGPLTRSYSGENPSGAWQTISRRPYAYDESMDFARRTMDDANGLPTDTCGAHPTAGVTDEQARRLYANSVVADGADFVFPDTVIDHYACLSGQSVTDGNGSWWLEKIAPVNPDRIFVQGLPVTGSAHLKSCKGEDVWWQSDGQTPSVLRQLMIDRMLEQCTLNR